MANNVVVDGSSVVLLHEERRSDVEIAREPRGWHDWDEHWYVGDFLTSWLIRYTIPCPPY